LLPSGYKGAAKSGRGASRRRRRHGINTLKIQ
jgi:hypothetical protein